MLGVKPGPLERDGFHLEPTLVEVADPTNPFTQEGVLAPVAALSKAGSAEEAMQIANGVRQGLVAAVYTNDLDRAMEFANHLEFLTNAPGMRQTCRRGLKSLKQGNKLAAAEELPSVLGERR